MLSKSKKLIFIIFCLVLLISPLLADDSELDSNPALSTANFDSSIIINDIVITGNKLISPEVIRNAISIKTGDKFSRRAVSYDLKTLDDLGYFDKDKLMAIPMPKGENGVTLKIEVVENPPLTGLVITGNNTIPEDELEDFLAPLIGMPRSTSQIRQAVNKIESYYHENGFLLATVTELEFDPDGFLTVKIDEGVIGKIEFIGNTKTREKYLRRIMPTALNENKAYNEENVIKYLTTLQKSGFFKNVKREFLPLEEDPSKHKLVFTIEEQRTKSLSLGTGLGTLNGVFGNVSFTEPNFRGRGENLTVSGVAGTGLLTALDGDTDGRFARRGDFQFQVSYADPYFLNSDTLGFNVFSGARRQGSFVVDGSLQQTINAGFSLNKRFGDKWSGQLGLTGSSVDMSNFGSAARNTLISSLITQQNRSSAQAIAEADAIRRDELADGFYLDLTPSITYKNIDATGTGWHNSFFGGPSIGLGDIDSYLTAGLTVKRYDKLTDAGLLFRDSFRLESQLGDSASFRRLRAAGPYGARGYKQFLQVGRGHTLISNTSELAIPIELPANPLGDTKLVFFNDLGLALGDKRLNDLYGRESAIASIGVGIEVNVPVLGPLRVDYGIPLIRPDNKSFFSGRISVMPGRRL